MLEMSKYIIKNCPCIKTDKYYLRGELITERVCTRNREELILCQSCTECLLKQIVKQSEYCLCPEILELLDIQEVE